MICFVWDGFPQYAARCVGAFVKTSREPVCVVAKRPAVPIRGMEDLCACRLIWIEDNETRKIDEICGLMPSVLFVSGWYCDLYNRFVQEVRQTGGRVIAMVDNNYVSFRFLPIAALVRFICQCIKALNFRLFLRRRFDAYFVPGRSGRRLLSFYGVPLQTIYEGLYAADERLFGARLLNAEPCVRNRIIYVGQFIDRKNVFNMCRAFCSANSNGAWTLDLYGSGVLRHDLEELAAKEGRGCVKIHNFLQPEPLAREYRNSMVFCLPSHEEHWGVVVHEAALSGCVLLLSDAIGSAADFANNKNSVLFRSDDLRDMTNAFRRVMNMSKPLIEAASSESVRLGLTNASIWRFVKAVTRIADNRERVYVLERQAGGFPWYQEWFVDAWKRFGGDTLCDVKMPHCIRAFMGRCFPWGWCQDSYKVIVPGSHRIESVAWPWCSRCEVVPMMWDLWPNNFKWFVRFLRRTGVRRVFCTSSQNVKSLTDSIETLVAEWIPEGVCVDAYPKGEPLEDRRIDVVNYGRQVISILRAIEGHAFKNRKIRLLCEHGGNAVFKNSAELVSGLQNSKMAICYPQSFTNKKQAGDVETLTLRYWECMLCGTLMIGHAPQELVRLCGYNPVVELKGDIGLQVEGILDNIVSYQELVNRNRQMAEKIAGWAGRMERIEQIVGGI